MNQLDILKKYSSVVIDTSDFNDIDKYKPEDATTNPSLILKSVLSLNFNYLIDQAIEYARANGGNRKKKIINACDMISVLLGSEILKKIPGFISTEIDARLSFNTEKCIQKAKKIIQLYSNIGIEKSRILIKMAATWECIQAAKYLKKIGILCNITLLFSCIQARICAENGVFLISPFVGRVYDWYVKNTSNFYHDVKEDPGVLLIKEIYTYYKQYDYKTIIMGASFRNIEQILAISGCDKITISPILLSDLLKSNVSFSKQLDCKKIQKILYRPKKLLESDFRWYFNQDKMAVDKLSEGIRQFGYDQEILEKFFENKI